MAFFRTALLLGTTLSFAGAVPALAQRTVPAAPDAIVYKTALTTKWAREVTPENAEAVQWACFQRGLLVLECGVSEGVRGVSHNDHDCDAFAFWSLSSSTTNRRTSISSTLVLRAVERAGAAGAVAGSQELFERTQHRSKWRAWTGRSRD